MRDPINVPVAPKQPVPPPDPAAVEAMERHARKATEVAARLHRHGILMGVKVARHRSGHMQVDITTDGEFVVALADMLADHLDAKP